MIDWGYPTLADRHLRLDDYVDFLDVCVDRVRRERGVESLTLWGYCLGTTLAVIYSSLFPEKVRNLVIQTPLVNFDIQNTLAVWAKNTDPVKVSRPSSTSPVTFPSPRRPGEAGGGEVSGPPGQPGG